MKRLLTGIGAAGLLWWLAAELWYWYASRAGVGRRQGEGSEAIIVLGYKNRGAGANAVNRYRVRAALRSLNPRADTTIYFCGGGVGSAISEAQILADYALWCGYRGAWVLEDQSRTTMENIENVIPLVEHAEVIKIVSNSIHTYTGRANLARLRPDLARRLVRAEEYRFAEIPLIKMVDICLEPVRRYARRSHHPRTSPPTD